MLTLTISTTARETMIDITDQLRSLVRKQGWTDTDAGGAADGSLMVFCPHTTCGLTINEVADPDVKHDLMRFFNEIVPHEHGWKHAEAIQTPIFDFHDGLQARGIANLNIR